MKGRWKRGACVVLAIGLLGGLAQKPGATETGDARVSSQTVKVGGQTFRCNVVTINLASGRLVPHVLIATGGIGRTEEFSSMVKRSRAVAAINGSFFDAYNPNPGYRDPGMTLIRNGQLIHKGGTGTVLGFRPRGIIMGRPDFPIRGSVAIPGRRGIINWYAYWINRTPTSPDNITIFTPARGARARVKDGICIVVDRGTVTRSVQGDVAIPALGYIIHLRGNEMQEANKFPRGAQVGFRVMFDAGRDTQAWQDVTEAIGAGPRLLTDGQITYDPQSEGFSSPKILSYGGLRSAIGVKRDGKVLLVTVGGPTVRQLASIMQQLGATQAMNLDGGASTALYCNGKTISPAGRPLSNVLAFVRP